MGPWTIKAVARTVQRGVIEDARKQGLTVGQFIERLYTDWKADGRPVPVASPGSGTMSTTELIEIARIAAQAKAAGQGGMNDAGQVGRPAAVRVSAGLLPPARRLPPSRKAAVESEG
jgi:hypothetical protein